MDLVKNNARKMMDTRKFVKGFENSYVFRLHLENNGGANESYKPENHIMR